MRFIALHGVAQALLGNGQERLVGLLWFCVLGGRCFFLEETKHSVVLGAGVVGEGGGKSALAAREEYAVGQVFCRVKADYTRVMLFGGEICSITLCNAARLALLPPVLWLGVSQARCGRLALAAGDAP